MTGHHSFIKSFNWLNNISSDLTQSPDLQTAAAAARVSHVSRQTHSCCLTVCLLCCEVLLDFSVSRRVDASSVKLQGCRHAVCDVMCMSNSGCDSAAIDHLPVTVGENWLTYTACNFNFSCERAPLGYFPQLWAGWIRASQRRKRHVQFAPLALFKTTFQS